MTEKSSTSFEGTLVFEGSLAPHECTVHLACPYQDCDWRSDSANDYSRNGLASDYSWHILNAHKPAPTIVPDYWTCICKAKVPNGYAHDTRVCMSNRQAIPQKSDEVGATS